MDSDPRENAQDRDQPQQRENVGPIISNSPKADVPVFSCIVYVSTTASGGVQARVANLPGIMCTAASER